jgi:hypothetical protein
VALVWCGTVGIDDTMVRSTLARWGFLLGSFVEKKEEERRTRAACARGKSVGEGGKGEGLVL